jgi:hypothetical protein
VRRTKVAEERTRGPRGLSYGNFGFRLPLWRQHAHSVNVGFDLNRRLPPGFVRRAELCARRDTSLPTWLLSLETDRCVAGSGGFSAVGEVMPCRVMAHSPGLSMMCAVALVAAASVERPRQRSCARRSTGTADGSCPAPRLRRDWSAWRCSGVRGRVRCWSCVRLRRAGLNGGCGGTRVVRYGAGSDE